jgi:hypothetical protein
MSMTSLTLSLSQPFRIFDPSAGGRLLPLASWMTAARTSPSGGSADPKSRQKCDEIAALG